MSTAKIESRIAQLEKEHQQASAALAAAQQARAEYAAELQTAQAAAARGGDAAAADKAEQHDDQLHREIQRQRAAVASINADLARANQELEQAQHAAQVKRLAAIHKEAIKLAAQLDGDMSSADTLGALVDLWAENTELARDLYGQSVELEGHPQFDQVMAHPDRAHAQRLDAIRYYALRGEYVPRDKVSVASVYRPRSMADALRLTDG